MGLIITDETSFVKFYSSATHITKLPKNSVLTELNVDKVLLKNGGDAGIKLIELTMDNVTSIDGVAPTDIADLDTKIEIIFQ